jgi:hypothetical protein
MLIIAHSRKKVQSTTIPSSTELLGSKEKEESILKDFKILLQLLERNCVLSAIYI